MNRYFSSVARLSEIGETNVIWDVHEQRMICETIRADDAKRITEAMNLHDRAFTHPVRQPESETT